MLTALTVVAALALLEAVNHKSNVLAYLFPDLVPLAWRTHQDAPGGAQEPSPALRPATPLAQLRRAA